MAFIAISSVSANEMDSAVGVDDAIVLANAEEMDSAVGVDDAVIVANAEERDDFKNIQTNDLKSSSNSNILKDANYANFTELDDLINNGNDDVLVLDKNYKFDDEIHIGRSITIDGNGHTLDAGDATRIFNIEASSVTIKNIIFKNAYSSANGGALCFSGSGNSVINCSFINCHSYLDGGAIYGADALDCRFVNCSSSYGDGGAVYGNGIKVENCSFSSCHASTYGEGGAVYISNGKVIGSSFSDCSASYYGGAIYFYYGKVDVLNCSFVKCSASRGGAIATNNYCDGGNISSCSFSKCLANWGNAVYTYDCTINDCRFVNCSNSTNNQALYFESTGSLFNSSFENNVWYGESFINVSNVSINGVPYDFISDVKNDSQIQLTKDYKVYSPLLVNASNVIIDGMGHSIVSDESDAFYIKGNNVTIKNIVFKNSRIYTAGRNFNLINCSFFNSTDYEGGALYLNYDSTVKDCSFVNCTSKLQGGAIYIYSNATIDNCTFENCTSGNSWGGAIYTDNGNCSVISCIFKNCFSDTSGGAIYFYPYRSNNTVSGCRFINCSSGDFGGAIYLSGNNSLFNNSFVNCYANTSGGAVYCSNVDIAKCSFENCSAEYGGALYIPSSYNCSLSDSSFVNNGWYSTKPLNISNVKVNGVPYDFFFDLKSNSKIELKKDYNVFSHVVDANNTVIDGKGHVISSFGEESFYIKGENVTFKNIIFNSSKIESYGQNFTLINCSFANSSARNGGALYAGYNANVLNCTFIDCNASEYGGALYLRAKENIISNSNFINCSSNFTGGAIFLYYNGTVSDCKFVDCSAEFGGSVYLRAGGYVIASRFINSSAVSGGALYFDYNSSCNVYDCIFEDCSAESGAGAIHFVGIGRVINSSFVKCSGLSGGALNFGSNSTGLVEDSSFENCTAKFGGAVYVYSDRVCIILNSSFMDCFASTGNATYNGAAINSTFYNYPSNKTAVYNTDLENCSFVVNRISPDIKIPSLNNLSNGSVVKVTLPSDASGNLTLTVNGKDHVFKVSKGVGNIVIPNLNNGKYNYTIKYSGDSKYSSLSRSGVLTVNNTGANGSSATNFALSSSNITKYYGGAEKYTVTLTKNKNPLAGEKVQITINNKTSTATTNSKGQASVDLNLTPGTYDVVSSYKSVSAKSKVTVKSTVTSSNSAGTYLNSKVSATFLNASGKALANTKVNFKVGSKTYTATTNNNGVATASVDLDVGTYTVTAINPKNNEQKTSKLTISKAKSTATLTATSNNGVVTLTANLSPSTASGNVIFNINNKNYTAKISSAKASQTITGLNVGTYTAKASYAGDKNLNSSSASTKVEVKKVIATKIIYEDMQTGPVPKSEGRIGNYFCVKLVDGKNNALAGVPIKIGFNGVIYNRTTNSEGGARLQINLANEDLYTFAICFLGDDDYQAAFEVAKIDVNKKYPKPNKANSTTNAANATATQHESRLKTYINYSNMDTKSVLKVEGRAGEYFVVKLLDNNKKPLADVPIKIGFNGVIYNRTTNATGQARLQINLLKPTLYTFAIAYLGDSKYQAAFEVAKITVKAQTPKLTTSSKTFKASAKTKSLSATLVSARGAAISGQKVSFTVNGKTYTGKTNSKGVATVNISLNKKGTYACTIKFSGMTGANAKTTKTAVKIV